MKLVVVTIFFYAIYIYSVNECTQKKNVREYYLSARAMKTETFDCTNCWPHLCMYRYILHKKKIISKCTSFIVFFWILYRVYLPMCGYVPVSMVGLCSFYAMLHVRFISYNHFKHSSIFHLCILYKSFSINIFMW